MSHKFKGLTQQGRPRPPSLPSAATACVCYYSVLQSGPADGWQPNPMSCGPPLHNNERNPSPPTATEPAAINGHRETDVGFRAAAVWSGHSARSCCPLRFPEARLDLPESGIVVHEQQVGRVRYHFCCVSWLSSPRQSITFKPRSSLRRYSSTSPFARACSTNLL